MAAQPAGAALVAPVEAAWGLKRRLELIINFTQNVTFVSIPRHKITGFEAMKD